MVEKPWGSYEVLVDEETYKVKRIRVNPDEQFSLQYHNHRFEHWIVVEGGGMITLNSGGRESYLPGFPGDTFHIIPKDVHRARAGIDGLVFIEVQRGQCSEDDIVRLEDDYGRITQR